MLRANCSSQVGVSIVAGSPSFNVSTLVLSSTTIADLLSDGASTQVRLLLYGASAVARLPFIVRSFPISLPFVNETTQVDLPLIDGFAVARSPSADEFAQDPSLFAIIGSPCFSESFQADLFLVDASFRAD